MSRVQFVRYPRNCYSGFGVTIGHALIPQHSGYRWELEIRFGRRNWYIGIGKV